MSCSHVLVEIGKTGQPMERSTTPTDGHERDGLPDHDRLRNLVRSLTNNAANELPCAARILSLLLDLSQQIWCYCCTGQEDGDCGGEGKREVQIRQ